MPVDTTGTAAAEVMPVPRSPSSPRLHSATAARPAAGGMHATKLVVQHIMSKTLEDSHLDHVFILAGYEDFMEQKVFK